MITPNDATNYLTLHLKSEIWLKASENQQQAALAMAENDIKNQLKCDEIDETNPFMLCALYEQALFLLERHLNNIDENMPISSQSIDGVGSTVYCSRIDSTVDISRRAQHFLERIAPINAISRG